MKVTIDALLMLFKTIPVFNWNRTWPADRIIMLRKYYYVAIKDLFIKTKYLAYWLTVFYLRTLFFYY